MGVPKFFRYISERYPCLSEVVSEYQLPEFDNLYLDMNGIIHVCSHPNDADPHFRITEEKIFRDIFHYIETLFRMIQPQKLFFMAVDGVAPRAKMNQQRGRRFRSAKDAEMAEERAQLRGETLPSAERFDSNCITPGTEFMTRLQAQLKYFVTFKVTTDRLWQKAKIILSGHEVPGEGEHKIMDYIRYMKSQSSYDPNTRHCLYGLDADLIMLGLCTHEPHFSLLREEVKYVKSKSQKRIPTPEETTFFLLHLSLMREYLDLEFQQLKTTLPFAYDLEHIIDDWVLMGFLVGNDFIPHLPDMHINKGALPILYRTYIEVLPTLGGYINEDGTLRLDRFQKYMEKLAAFDLEQFKEYSADMRFFESKTSRKMGGRERHSYKENEEPSTPPKNKELAALIAATDELMQDGSEDDDDNYIDMDSDEEEDEDDTCFAEFCAHKKNYYMEKLAYDKVTPEVLRSQGEGYVRAIQWNLNYYYNGCCSWSWFYPHHYAPYISDIKNFSSLELKYDIGKPFLPFQQLLAVLPAASKKLLPAAYHDLMEGDNSPIISFYPTEFKTDLNGKRQDWEAVVLIPFIDQGSLLNAMATKEQDLTEEEKQRNRHGPMQIFTYTPENLGTYPAPAHFPDITCHHAKVEEINRDQLHVEPNKLVRGLCPGVKLEVFYSGFPTLKHIPFKAELGKCKVKVFETASQGDNMIMTILPQGHPEVSEVATQLLGKSIYVNWPHLFEARVVAVSNLQMKFSLKGNDDTIVQEDMNKITQEQWELSRKGIETKYMNRMGINVGKTEILVYACSLEDKKYVLDNDKMCCEKQWASYPIAYALQTTRTNIAVYEPEPSEEVTIERMFPSGKAVFVLDQQYYGSQARVLEIVKNKRVKVSVTVDPEPNLEEVQYKSRKLGPHYQPGNAIASQIKINPHLVSRITGTIYILTGNVQDAEANSRQRKLNIGLNLKFNKRNEEVCGYTRRTTNGYWLYSERAVQEVVDYRHQFPEVFEYLSEKGGAEDIRDCDLYPEDTETKLKELGNWLKERDSNNAERQKCNAQTLSEEVVKALEEVVDKHLSNNKENNPTVTLYVKPSNLYIPKPKLGQAPDPKVTSYQLFDRVVSIRESHSVPLGFKGTIIGIHYEDKGNGSGLQQAMYDIVFDRVFTGGLKIRCSPNRAYRLQGQALINLSHGLRSDSSRAQGKPTAVVEPSSGVEEEANTWNSNGYNSAFVNWRDRPSHDAGGSPLKQQSHGLETRGRRGPPEFSWAMDRSRHQPQNLPKQSAPHQLSREYLAMFTQLQNTPLNPKAPGSMKGGGGGGGGVGGAVDPITESSRALKNMLKIKTPEYGSKPPQLTQPLPAQSPKKPLPNAAHSYCTKLLGLHQKYGLKLPRYHYMDSRDGLIVGTVLCGNGQEFQGEPAFANEPAAESAAYKALQVLVGGMDDHKRGLGVMGPSQFRSPNPPLLMPQCPPFPQHAPSHRMASNWMGREQIPPPPPDNWFPNSFKQDWRANNRVSHTGFFMPPQVLRFQPPSQGQLSPLFPVKGSQWQQPRQPFIPPQAESRFRQAPPSPREPPRDKPPPSEQRSAPVSQGQQSQQPPRSVFDRDSTPPASRPPRKSRIAAKFSNPFSDEI